MDLGTVVGIGAGVVLIVLAIVAGGSPGLYYNTPSVLIVIGGTISTTLIRFPLPRLLHTFGIIKNAFLHRLSPTEEIMSEMIDLSGKARQEGVLSLESYESKESFLNRGLQLIVDGNEAEAVQDILATDIRNLTRRHRDGRDILNSIAVAAPAFGMIGTLIGLVAMLANMEDVKQLGPAMAVAILTTLYGAIIANLIADPLAKKLEVRSKEESLNRQLMLVGLMSIVRGENPRIMENAMRAFFSKKQEAPPTSKPREVKAA
ncbi:MAG: motility protein A [Acidobacteriota bacterium]